jgi:hypothetical protein
MDQRQAMVSFDKYNKIYRKKRAQSYILTFLKSHMISIICFGSVFLDEHVVFFSGEENFGRIS